MHQRLQRLTQNKHEKSVKICALCGEVHRYNIHLRFFSILALIVLLTTNSSIAQPYFQQQVNYTIHVSLNDKTHFLNSLEEIEYQNNSPDTLSFIYFHLWPNAYKNDNTALAKQMIWSGETDFHYSKDEDRGYIDSVKFISNKVELKWEYDSQHIDICKVQLNHPLKPGEKILLSIPFRVKLPLATFSRLGHIDQAYYISQWYPKPAVYDKNGWNPMPYLNQGEFYSEFGNFDVYITLPKNYVVAATGDLPENDPELEFLSRKSAETYARTEFKDDESFPTSDTTTKTLHYHQEKVHDFAWFADKRYHVLKGEVQLPYSNRMVTTWSMFTNKGAQYWKNGVQYLNDAIYYYSLWNGDYPYKHATAVDGTIAAGGGMEYPNVSIINTPVNSTQLDLVIAHEVGHNWFYGILGTNERKHPWMDEGINSYNEKRYIETKYPRATLLTLLGLQNVNLFGLANYKYSDQYYLSYLISARANADQSMSLPAIEYSKLNYPSIVYAKSAQAFSYLAAYLGQDVFDSCMQRYYKQWQFKHPDPEDLKTIFTTYTGKNLDWFFKNVFSEQKLDYKLCRFKRTKEGYKVKLKNTTNLIAPVGLTLTFTNDSTYTTWIDGFKNKQTFEFKHADLKKVTIDDNIVMTEINRRNNQLKSKGVFKQIEPIQLKFIGAIEDPKHTQLFWTPVLGYNYYNDGMVGIALYNRVFPEKPMEFVIVPMYSIGKQSLVGLGYISRSFKCKKVFQEINTKISLWRFGELDYNFLKKTSPEVTFLFKKKRLTSSSSNAITLRSVFSGIDIWERFSKPSNNFKYLINEIKFNHQNDKKINPYHGNISLQNSDQFTKIFGEFNYKISYKSNKRGVNLRLFAGNFLFANKFNQLLVDYEFTANGGNGNNDYMYDHIFLGRGTTLNQGTWYSSLFANQFTENNGNLKAYSPYGRTTNWLGAFNVNIALPGKIPLSLFADLCTYANAKKELKTSSVLYDAGVNIVVIRDIVNIYIPVLVSSQISDFYKLNKYSFMERIRFTLNLKKLNPFEFTKNAAGLL